MLFSVRFGMSNQIKSNQIKSNQIILSNITCPIHWWIQDWYPWIWVSEGRSKQSSKHNSHFISFQFTYFSWLMYCQNYHDHWLLFCDYLSNHHQEHNIHWMRWCVVLEDLEWEMKMKMNNHHILSNTAKWQFVNENSPKDTISNDGRSKTSFSFLSNHILFFSFTHLLTKNQHSINNIDKSWWIEENWHWITRIIWNL